MITFEELRAHAVTKSGVQYEAVSAFIDRVEEASKVEPAPVELVPELVIEEPMEVEPAP